MRHERVFLESIVESVADGVDIDWVALEERVDDDGDRRVLAQLKVLARIAEVHRSHAHDPDDRLLGTRGAGGKVIPMQGRQPADLIASADDRLESTLATQASAAPAAPHARWGHLALYERIGEGTFGEVYRARDTRLDREVAVKLLRVGGGSTDAQTRRVLQEGRSLARVTHDNVVTVHGAETYDGRTGLWMALIRGATLEQLLRAHGAFSAREAALIGQDLCSAVAAVHKAGLVHRDIKPQNVMREEGGRLVLMDFGAGQLAGNGAAGLDRLTGTPLYLAPEVLAGGESSVQSDIYSIGVLLYHLVTNDYPARAASLDDLRDAHAQGRRVHLHDARPELPPGLIQVIERALDPSPARRYQTAGEMRAALDRVFAVYDDRRESSSALTLPTALVSRLDRPGGTRVLAMGVAASIAVLAVAGVLVWQAFQPATTGGAANQPRIIAMLDLAHGEGVQDHEAASVTEGIQDLLSTADAVRLVSRRSVQVASRNDLSAPDLATKLNADTLIEGRLEQVHQDYRLTLRLVRAGSDHSIAVGTFTAPLTKRLMLLYPAAEATARALGLRLPPSAGAKSRSTQELANEAHDRYTRARYFLNTGAHNGHPDVAVKLFEEAIAAAPGYGQAHAGLARARYYNAMASRQQLWVRLAEARETAAHALRLDPTLAEAQAVIGVVDFYNWKWKDAERAFRQAIRANPSDEFAAERYATFLAARGRVDEGLARMVQVRRIDPMSPLIACSTATVLHYAGRYDEALAEIQRARSLDLDDPAVIYVQGRILAAAGRYDEAIASFQQAYKANGARTPLADIAAAEAAAGRRDKALAMMAELEAHAQQSGERFPPELFGFVYAQLGDLDRAFESLERAAQERSPRLLLLNVDPRAKPLRRDPRFAMLLDRLEIQASIPDDAR